MPTSSFNQRFKVTDKDAANRLRADLGGVSHLFHVDDDKAELRQFIKDNNPEIRVQGIIIRNFNTVQELKDWALDSKRRKLPECGKKSLNKIRELFGVFEPEPMNNEEIAKAAIDMLKAKFQQSDSSGVAYVDGRGIDDALIDGDVDMIELVQFIRERLERNR